MRVVFIGTVAFSLSTLKHLISMGVDIVGVWIVSQRSPLSMKERSSLLVRMSGLDRLSTLVLGASTLCQAAVPVALSAIELAHRWQAEGDVGMLERALVPLLAAETFAPIANEAALKELRLLSSSCITFARDEPSAADALVEKGDQLRDPRLQIN